MTTPSSQPSILAGDIGGTNTRLGIFSIANRQLRLNHVKAYASREAAGLEQILEQFMKTTNASIAGACFGIAGPVSKGRCQITNLPWTVSERQIRKHFNWPRVRLINDLSALAHSVAILDPAQLHTLNRGEPVAESPMGLMAPGTGLGMALLVPSDDRFLILSSEGGHTDFAPANEIEGHLWLHLHRSWGHVSVERVLSGPGLVNIYQWLRQTGRLNEPAWLSDRLKTGDPAKVISESALKKSDPTCVEALELFISIFGAEAGNLALIGLTRAGIYLGGGIAPQILPTLEEGRFLESFTNKGRFRQLLQSIPVYVILNEHAPLLGAAACALKNLGPMGATRRPLGQ